MIKKIITNDEFYEHLEDNPELLIKAGWFDDEQTLKERKLKYNLDLLCTPFYKLKKPINNKPIVLLSTGGFSPLHKGHLKMMDEAYNTLTKSGYDVVGGYFSPSHDKYVLNKHNKTFSTENRIKSTEELIFDNERYMTCPWESVHNSVAINFTDCIQRLKEYLRKHFHPNTEVCYVFGGDNEYFLQAFKHKGLAFCLSRGKELDSLNEGIVDNQRLFFCSFNENSEVKSRELDYNIKEKKGIYLIRDDIDLPQKEEIILLFKKYFAKIGILPREYNPKAKFKTISLDVHFKGDYNLSITRKFNFGNQFKGKEIISRNKTSLEEQIKLIPKGKYSLVDDDIASGFTINYIKEILKKNGIIIKEEISLMSTLIKEEILDVVDLRDFVFGEEFGGLTIELPNGKMARVPYISPLVDLNFRASLSYEEGNELSKGIIRINKEIHEITKIKDLPESQQELFYFYGFSNNDYLNEALDVVFKRNN